MLFELIFTVSKHLLWLKKFEFLNHALGSLTYDFIEWICACLYLQNGLNYHRLAFQNNYIDYSVNNEISAGVKLVGLISGQ